MEFSIGIVIALLGIALYCIDCIWCLRKADIFYDLDQRLVRRSEIHVYLFWLGFLRRR